MMAVVWLEEGSLGPFKSTVTLLWNHPDAEKYCKTWSSSPRQHEMPGNIEWQITEYRAVHFSCDLQPTHKTLNSTAAIFWAALRRSSGCSDFSFSSRSLLATITDLRRGLMSGVPSPRLKMMSQAPSTSRQNLSPMNPGIFILRRRNPLMGKKMIISYILVSADPNFGEYKSAESTPEQVKQAWLSPTGLYSRYWHPIPNRDPSDHCQT